MPRLDDRACASAREREGGDDDGGCELVHDLVFRKASSETPQGDAPQTAEIAEQKSIMNV
jgi:hypothetical protein